MKQFGLLSALTVGLVLVACGDSNSFDDTTKARVDCLSAKTVMAIADTIREGTEAGLSLEELSGVQAEKTTEGLKTLRTSGLNEETEAYFEFETARRMNAMQEALRSGDRESEEFQIMTETRTLARSCSFDAA